MVGGEGNIKISLVVFFVWREANKEGYYLSSLVSKQTCEMEGFEVVLSRHVTHQGIAGIKGTSATPALSIFKTALTFPAVVANIKAVGSKCPIVMQYLLSA